MNTPEWIKWMSDHFSPEQYLFWTRWQCVFWTLADLVLVYFVVRLSNLARLVVRRAPHRYSYLILAFTASLLPFVAVAPSGGMLFLVEIAITVPHFLLLGYLLSANVAVYASFLGVLLGGEARNPGRS